MDDLDGAIISRAHNCLGSWVARGTNLIRVSLTFVDFFTATTEMHERQHVRLRNSS